METNETPLDTYVIEIYGGHDTYVPLALEQITLFRFCHVTYCYYTLLLFCM